MWANLPPETQCGGTASLDAVGEDASLDELDHNREPIIRFNETIDVQPIPRVEGAVATRTRSQNQVPANIPNVLPGELERSTQLRERVREAHEIAQDQSERSQTKAINNIMKVIDKWSLNVPRKPP